MENLYQFFEEVVKKNASRLLFVKENITYAQALEKIKTKVVFLQKEGFQKDDVLAILAVNSADWLITYFAITSLGAYALLLDTNLPQDEYQRMLNIVEAKAVFASGKLQFKFANIKTYDIAAEDQYGDILEFKEPAFGPDQIASLSFTSGTTGNAKVVPLSHFNVFRTSIATAKRWGKDYENKIVYGILPIYHVYGMVCAATGPIAAGSSIVFQTSLKAPDILKDLRDYQVQVFPAVPRIWETFFDRIVKKYEEEHKIKLFKFFAENGSWLKWFGLGKRVKSFFKPVQELFGGNILFMVSGGAALKRNYEIAYRNMGFKMSPGYGLTETVGPVIVNKTDVPVIGCVGTPTEGNYLEIRNADAEGVGEIWLKGDSVFKGYYKNPAATAEVFDNNGWFNSGDLGLLDKKRFLHIRGRKKNVIVLASGKNVYPDDLMAYYQKAPEINELVVFGRRIVDKETVYAVIVPEHKTKDSYEQIAKVLKKMNYGLPSYKRIGKFAIAFDALPKTSTQKIKNHEVEALLDKGVYQLRADDPNFVVKELVGETPEEENIITLFREKLNVDVIYVNQKLEDYQIDSLDYIELISFMEDKLSIKIDSGLFVESANMKELIGYIKRLFIASNDFNAEEYIKGVSANAVVVNGFFNPLVELGLWLVKMFSKLFWRVDLKNKETLDINNNIVIANHQSYLDFFWLYSNIPYKYRKNIYIAIRLKYLFLRFLVPGLAFIFVDRERSKYIPILKAEADLLRLGKSILVFPEGVRTPNGNLGKFRTGAAFLAHSLKKEIVPITINGAFDIMPRHKHVPILWNRRGSLLVHQKVSPLAYKNYEELNDELKKIVMSELN